MNLLLFLLVDSPTIVTKLFTLLTQVLRMDLALVGDVKSIGLLEWTLELKPTCIL
jgi:hypothetical protein